MILLTTQQAVECYFRQGGAAAETRMDRERKTERPCENFALEKRIAKINRAFYFA
jgi:hypothetical protein